MESARASPSFQGVVDFLNSMADASRSAKPGQTRANIIQRFIDNYRQICSQNVYPFVRLILPQDDNKRRAYHVKEQTLANLYIRVLGLNPEGADAKALVNWKSPATDDSEEASNVRGDFAAVLHTVLKKRSLLDVIKQNDLRDGTKNYTSLTVAQVNDLLDLMRSSTWDAHIDRLDILTKLNESLASDEHVWVIRIMLKDLKVAIPQKAVFNAIHPQANELFNTCSDLEKVCTQLSDPKQFLDSSQISIRPGNPFKPMLCLRPIAFSKIVHMMHNPALRSANTVGAQEPLPLPEKHHHTSSSQDSASLSQPWSNSSQEQPRFVTDPNLYLEEYTLNDFIIEEKVDGERIQIHKMGSSYMYFSRIGTDTTDRYGASPQDQGSLTSHLHGMFQENVNEIILDAEIVAWDPARDKAVPFGDVKDYASRRSFAKDDPYPRLIIFDVLYANGRSLIKRPLWKRRQFLAKAVIPDGKHAVFSRTCKASTGLDIRMCLNTMISEDGEGIVVKNPDSLYLVDARNDMWIKCKPEYINSLQDSLDLCVMGGYYAGDARRGKFSSFLCGLRDSSAAHGTTPVFLSLVRVGGGFSIKDYNTIESLTAGKWIPFNKTHQAQYPFFVFGNLGSKWYPDEVILPSDSFVIEVKAAEISHAADYGAKYSLRFPRFVRFRFDKGPQQAMSLQEFINFTNDRKGLTEPVRDAFGNRTENYDIIQRKDRKRRDSQESTSPKKAARRSVKTHALLSPPSTDSEARPIFSGLLFLVAGVSYSEKSKIETEIFKHNGRITHLIPQDKRDFLIIGENMDAVKFLKKFDASSCDVLKPKWVFLSIFRGSLAPKAQSLFANASEPSRLNPEFHATLTPDQDMRTETSDDEGSSASETASQDESFKSEREHEFSSIPSRTAPTVISDLVVFLDTPESRSSLNLAFKDAYPSDLKDIQFRALANGVTVADQITDPSITHVVSDSNEVRQRLVEMSSGDGRAPALQGTYEWLVDSLTLNEVLETKAYVE